MDIILQANEDNASDAVKYERALREIVNVLGPEYAGCRGAEPHCEGCLCEASIALDTARVALGMKPLTWTPVDDLDEAGASAPILDVRKKNV